MFLLPVFAFKGKLLRRIDARDLTHMETVKNYVRVYHVSGQTYMVRCTLVEAVSSLRPLFVHVSRNTAVSILHIDKIDKAHLVVGEKTSINIAKSYYRPLIDYLGIIGKTVEREDEATQQDQPEEPE